MMLNQAPMTVEPSTAERALTSSHATATIPAAWHTPLPAHPESRTDFENPTTTTTLRDNSQPVPAPRSTVSRQTKIIATLGPATASGEMLRSLLEAGVSAFRVNPAGIGREAALQAVYAIRSISTDLQRPVALVLDTQLLPARDSAAPAITDSEWADIRFGLECGVDCLAVSAGREGEAVRQLRQFLAEQKKTSLSILARIESPSTIVALDAILQDADGVILGGGDAVSEVPTGEKLREWQVIASKCVRLRKVAVIATRANADVTSVLALQPDAVMLTAETSVGDYPLKSVQTLDDLIRQAETNDRCAAPADVTLTTEQDRIVAAAVQQALATNAEAIVIITRSGTSAALCAALRPHPVRVVAFTPDARLARRLRVRYALEPIVLPFTTQPKTTLAAVEKALYACKFVEPGAKLVFITDQPDQDQPTSGKS